MVVEGPGLGRIELDAHSLASHLHLLDEKGDDEIKRLIELARWGARQTPRTIAFTDTSDAPAWKDVSLPEADAAELRRRFRDGEPFALRIPVSVQCRGAADIPSHFDLFVQHDTEGRGTKPVYIRDGLVIQDVRDRRIRGQSVHARVVIEEGPLATLLGDVETPAHTHWNPRCENFVHRRYPHGKDIIKYVEDAPTAIANLLAETPEGLDTFTLAAFFPVPPDDDDMSTRVKRKKRREVRPEGDTDDDADPPPKRPKSFRIDKVVGGFTVSRASPDAPRPKSLRIRAAYDRLRGDPMAKWNPADFRFEGMRPALTGAMEHRRKDNILEINLVDDDFRVEMNGFDVNRDLKVEVRAFDAQGRMAEADDAEEVA